jgi:hypothetical protein
MKLLWLESAEEDLDSIYIFYSTDKSINAAIWDCRQDPMKNIMKIK